MVRETVQLMDLHIFTIPQVIFEAFCACFGKILVSLMKEPYIDFGLKLGELVWIHASALHFFKKLESFIVKPMLHIPCNHGHPQNYISFKHFIKHFLDESIIKEIRNGLNNYLFLRY